MEHSKDTEHVAGNSGFSKKAILTKMWSMSESLPVPQWVIDPSGMSEMRLCLSSQSSKAGAHGDVGSSGGDQQGECMLKSPPMMRGSSGRGSVKRCCR